MLYLKKAKKWLDNKPIRNWIWNILLNYVKPTGAYIGRKFGSYFQIKDQTQFTENHDVIYHGKMVNTQKHIA